MSTVMGATAEGRPGEAGTTGEPRVLHVDTDQVAQVIGFYRRSALEVAAVAADLQAHDFGRWARRGATDAAGRRDEAEELGALDLDALAGDYARMARGLIDRLVAHAAAAEQLADALQHGTHRVADTDADAAGPIRAALTSCSLAADEPGRA